MANWLIVIIISILFVGLFVLGMSLTLIFKGRNIDSEISTNKHMKDRGIRCAVQDTRSDDRDVDCADVGCHSNCAACDVEQEQIDIVKEQRNEK